MRHARTAGSTVLWLTMSLLLAAPLRASELPIRWFTTSDGLNDTHVNRIVRDSRGLLWICTSSGISRFDGTRFQNFDNFDDQRVMPYGSINDLLETSEGYFWLASNGGGIIRFALSRDLTSAAFSVSPEPTTNRVNIIARARDGTIWAGTDGGLFQMSVRPDATPVFTRIPLHVTGHPDATVQIWSVASDDEGRVWIGTRYGLIRRLPDGRMSAYPVSPGNETDHVLSILHHEGRLWIAHQSGLTIYKPFPVGARGSEAESDQAEARAILVPSGRPLEYADAPGVTLPRQPGESVHLRAPRADASPRVGAIVRGGSGTIYVFTADAIITFAGDRFATLWDARFHAARMSVGIEDRDGNLWIASQTGALRISRRGFKMFGPADGLGPMVPRVFVTPGGDLIATSERWRVSRFEGDQFHTVAVNLPASMILNSTPPTLGTIVDRTGDWWFGTTQGLFRFSGIHRIDDLATAVPRRYSSQDGLAQDDVRSLFEDSRGGIWCAGLIPAHEGVTRWDRATGRFRKYSDADGLQPFNAVGSFQEDRQGTLWITFRDGGIGRYDAATDRFQMLTEANGLPAGGIGLALTDSAGRLWCPNVRTGLFRIDDLNSVPVRAVTIAALKPFGNRSVLRVLEGGEGSIYLVTKRGLIRIHEIGTGPAATWRVEGLYTADAGLGEGEVLSTVRDRQGRLWFGRTQGISSFDPTAREPWLPPEIRIGSVRVAGLEQRLSPAGEQRIPDIELAPGRSQLEIEVFAISYALGESLTFEHRLLGADDEWSAPSPSRSMLFSNLAPGRYQLEVRAVSVTGERSSGTARASLRVLPPVWQRWWFLSVAALLVLGGVVSFDRYRAAHAREIARAREERLAELEQVRKRIAADLHDEIGSSLTQISILSEVAVCQGAQVVPELNQPLSAIATSSRELVDAMSDIVWAINPAKDHLSDLTQRMRRLAADAFTASEIAFRLELPAFDEETALGANVRREVFLIFKEAVTNIVKHSRCTEASVSLSVASGNLRLDVRDNGQGFIPDAETDGHGLESLRARVAALRGTLTIGSSPGAGTVISLHLPIAT